MAAKSSHQLGREIRHFRRKAGISQIELGRQVAAANQTVSGYETGRSTPDRDTIERIDTVLSAGGALVQSWERLTDDQEIPDRWRRYQDVEQDAVEIREFHADIIPGILQTREYATAIIKNTSHWEESELKQLVDARVSRIDRVARAKLSFILNEMALRNIIGSREIQAGQIARIISLIETQRIVFSIIPLDTPNHPCPSSSFRLMTLDNGRVVGHEGHFSGYHVSTAKECQELVSRFGLLQIESLPTNQTLKLLRQIEKEMSDGQGLA